MKKIPQICLFILLALLMSSCYTRQLYYSFEPSHGGVTVGSSYYYLAQVREYKLPKGISRFPDGGMSKEIRQVFGLFRTDSIENKTFLELKLKDVYGWPVRYSTRIDRNKLLLVFGIANLSFPDSLDGIYIYNLKSKSLKKYSDAKALPAVSESNNQVAYCVENKLSIYDYDGIQLFSYVLNTKPAFVEWKNEDEILIYHTNPFMVLSIKLSTGKTTETSLEYLPNYAQEKTKSQIIRVTNGSNPNLKEFLGK